MLIPLQRVCVRVCVVFATIIINSESNSLQIGIIFIWLIRMPILQELGDIGYKKMLISCEYLAKKKIQEIFEMSTFYCKATASSLDCFCWRLLVIAMIEGDGRKRAREKATGTQRQHKKNKKQRKIVESG